MDRRSFVHTAALVTCARSIALLVPAPVRATDTERWLVHEVTTSVQLPPSRGLTRLWIPTPLSGSTPSQRLQSTSVHCETGHASCIEHGAVPMVYARYAAGISPALTVTHRIATRDWTVPVAAAARSFPQNRPPDSYLAPTSYLPTDGIVRQRAEQITQGQSSDLDKTRAIYTWIVANTYRNSKVRGCGVGSIRPMLESGDLGGKCADLNALFVGLLRASGVPARDAYGLRVGPSHFAASSCLGIKGADATKAQHCRAEVFLGEFGWVPMDPGDVRKVMLEEPPGQLAPTDERVTATSKRLFGSWEGNWFAYNYAQDVTLPGSSGPPLQFFMYPQAEVGGTRIDPYSPADFKYEITVRSISA